VCLTRGVRGEFGLDKDIEYIICVIEGGGGGKGGENDNKQLRGGGWRREKSWMKGESKGAEKRGDAR